EFGVAGLQQTVRRGDQSSLGERTFIAMHPIERTEVCYPFGRSSSQQGSIWGSMSKPPRRSASTCRSRCLPEENRLPCGFSLNRCPANGRNVPLATNAFLEDY